jgi:hypothetical protein
MLKNYADKFFALDLRNQSNKDFFEDALSYLDDYPFFMSYSAARAWIRKMPNGIYLRPCAQSKLVSQNQVLLFDSFYFVLPYLAKQEFIACLKKGSFEVIKK